MYADLARAFGKTRYVAHRKLGSQQRRLAEGAGAYGLAAIGVGNGDGITNSQQGYNGSWELAPGGNEQNIPPTTTRLWKFGMDQIYAPFFNNFMITDRKKYKTIVNHILNVWDIQIIIPCHGDIIRGKTNCQNALKKAFQIV